MKSLTRIKSGIEHRLHLREIKNKFLGKSADSKPLVFVVGLQKSGNTLLGKLLVESGYVEDIAKGEAHEFWGNVPVFTPTAFPAGAIYQKYNGDHGHQADVSDVDDKTKHVLNERLANSKIVAPIALNRGPFNSVRIPWLRELFPYSYIVSITRDPVANVFSLYKKFHDHPDVGTPPEDGWWGVKPKGWKDMLNDDKIVQISMQCKAIQKKLNDDKELINLQLTYNDLCSRPEYYIKKIISDVLHREVTLKASIPSLSCLDDEYTRGARVRSKNQDYSKTREFSLSTDEPVEIKPFTEEQIAKIKSICE